MASSSKKHRVISEDRISQLPDGILCQILSLLPTIFAVRTTVLSHRWNKLWKYVSSLDFDDEKDFAASEPDRYGSEPFLNFVDRVMLFRKSFEIRKFRLSIKSLDISVDTYSRIDCWICSAIRRKVVELDFTLHRDHNHMDIFELPRSVFMCKTLEILRITSDCITCAPPPPGSFPSLKCMHVSVDIPEPDWAANVFSCCPILEVLIINGRSPSEAVTFNICAPNLKTLTVHLCTDNDVDINSPPYNVFIDAPKLESLYVGVNKLSNYHAENAKSLVIAKIDLKGCEEEQESAFANRVKALLPVVSSVKYLSLEAYSVLEKNVRLNLNKKDLVFKCYYWHWLSEFLEASPNLEDLALQNSYEESSVHAENESVDMEVLDVSDDTNIWNDVFQVYLERWNPPVFVPICLSSHLRSVTIRGFIGQQAEMEVAKYLLKNSEVLKKVTIHYHPYYTDAEELSKKFLMFEKGCAVCQVVFIPMQEQECKTNS